jgi:23S rRNA (cytosine1962-C5)-methyltransferase
VHHGGTVASLARPDFGGQLLQASVWFARTERGLSSEWSRLRFRLTASLRSAIRRTARGSSAALTLYIRAMESQRPDALIKDEKAVALVTQMDYDFSRIKQIKIDEEDKVTLILRNREFDRYARDFLARRIAVRVTPWAERALRRGHPWLFETGIRQQSHAGRPGDLAVVFNRARRFLAVGLYDPHSSIRVRVLQHGRPATIDREWFRARLSSAAERRAPLLASPPGAATTGYRLVHGENDGFPGLVIDRYERTWVLKIYTPAWVPHLRDVLAALEESVTIPVERVVLRLGRAVLEQPQALYGLRDGSILRGPALEGPLLFRENGLCFEVDPVHGQKTGFFLDQRDNRARVERLAAGKLVLNLFAYTGGFSIYAARGGARHIVSLDASEPALAAAVHNMAHNRTIPAVAAASHEIVIGDAFDGLARLRKSGQRFDLVIVDPPAFAQRQAQVAQALSAYARLTRLSLGVLAPGGILVQASCSSRVDAQAFFEVVQRAAAQVGRPLREIERSGHALDHPIAFKEGAYLKCLFAVAP